MDDVRTYLTVKLAEIDVKLTGMSEPPTEQSNISFGKRVGDGTQMAVDRLSQVAVHGKIQITRADVARALEKLDDGTYGACDVCGDAIPEGRLEVHPWAIRCVEDAARSRRS